jgi:hypothetical protein
MTNADMGILVCRSNRIWTEDQSSVNNLLDQSASKIKFIVNGVLHEIESVLSDLPEKIKAMFKFHFSKKPDLKL